MIAGELNERGSTLTDRVRSGVYRYQTDWLAVVSQLGPASPGSPDACVRSSVYSPGNSATVAPAKSSLGDGGIDLSSREAWLIAYCWNSMMW